MNTRRARTSWLLIAAAVCATNSLRGQQPPPLEDLRYQPRPHLSARADTNDWEAYFDYAVDHLRSSPEKARLAFFWATRLDPRRAEPLYGRWVAYWRGRPGWWEAYVLERPEVVEAPQVLRVDSVLSRALYRNPFVPQTLTVLLFDQLSGRWGHDPLTNALLDYSAGRLPESAQDWAIMIGGDREAHPWLHYDRALAFTGMQIWDSAATEMNQLLAVLRAQDTTQFHPVYHSREMLLYAIGLLQRARGDRAAARTALEQALVENLSFFPAHATLGQMAMSRGDTATGMRELAMALELSNREPWMRYLYGQGLAHAGRASEAAAQFDTLTAEEPYFSAAYLDLGAAREAAGFPDQALVAYQRFLQLAPRSDTTSIERARVRVVTLGGQNR